MLSLSLKRLAIVKFFLWSVFQKFTCIIINAVTPVLTEKRRVEQDSSIFGGYKRSQGVQRDQAPQTSTISCRFVLRGSRVPKQILFLPVKH